ncbi:hypothetical protein CASFOL_007883 [Castilleja foliolosa]|uniref:NADH-quinone oxidoreductase subunit D domain-containing protein n=1 Tax=Castilleja foliolosa TaxID=1961234 RepID=A0ABD3E5V7_9LAMI
MTESIKIIQQALEGIPGGPYENLEIRRFNRRKDPEWNDFEYRFISKKPSPTFELSKQELYVRVEAPKGELGIFMIGDQSVFPWRWKIRPPGLFVCVVRKEEDSMIIRSPEPEVKILVDKDPVNIFKYLAETQKK